MEGERTAVTYCWLGHQMCHKKAPLSQQRCLFPWQPAAMSRWHAFLWWGRRRQGWWPMESSSRAAYSWRRMKTAAWPLLATSECCRWYPAIVWGDFIAATSHNFFYQCHKCTYKCASIVCRSHFVQDVKHGIVYRDKQFALGDVWEEASIFQLLHDTS